MGQITKNFKLAEFAVSEGYPHLANRIVFSELDKIKLFYMCALILQPVRDWLSIPVKILSGKRTPELNDVVGGAPNSDHLFKYASIACDFTVPGYDMERVWHWMQGTNIPKKHQSFGQLIFYPSKNFIPVSFVAPKHHGEVLCR